MQTLNHYRMNYSAVSDNSTASEAPTTKEEYEIISFTAYFLCTLIGLPGNILALCFFASKSRDLATVIYIFITAFDILISILMLPIALPFLYSERLSYLLYSQWFCAIWGILWFSGSLMTIFLVAVVSITRCICITFPLAKLFLKKSVVVGVILVYIVFTLSQATIPFWVGKKYEYYRWHVGICIWTTYVLNDYPTAKNIATNLYLLQLYGLIAPIIFTSLITVCVLRRPRSRMSQSNYNVTISILCFTSLYLICNIPPVTYQIMAYVHYRFNSPYAGQYMVAFTIGANSALNPLLYYWRTKPFRRFIAKKLEESKSILGGSRRSQRLSTMSAVGITPSRHLAKQPSPCTYTTRVSTSMISARYQMASSNKLIPRHHTIQDKSGSPRATSPFLSPTVSPHQFGRVSTPPSSARQIMPTSAGCFQRNGINNHSKMLLVDNHSAALSNREVYPNKNDKRRVTTAC